MIRFSKASDLDEIKSLIELCFGDRERAGAYDNIAGRYLVYEKDGRIVAMTGLTCDTQYPSGVEVDWTCTHPDYRQMGIMSELFGRLMQLTDEPIYCSCWHVSDKAHANLHKIMLRYGFVCVRKGHIKCNPYRCGIESIDRCVNYVDNCTCSEDLYLRCVC